MKVTADIAQTHWTANVYPPSEDSFALVDALYDHLIQTPKLPKLCLEIGCGSGYVSVSLVLMLKALGHQDFYVVATDINPEAVECTKETAKAHHVEQHMDVLLTHLTDGFRLSSFDWILFNPPYVPTPNDELKQTGIVASWAGGLNGRVVMDAFLERVFTAEREESSLEVFLVTIAENRPFEMMEHLKQRGFDVVVVRETRAGNETLVVLLILLQCLKSNPGPRKMIGAACIYPSMLW